MVVNLKKITCLDANTLRNSLISVRRAPALFGGSGTWRAVSALVSRILCWTQERLCNHRYGSSVSEYLVRKADTSLPVQGEGLLSELGARLDWCGSKGGEKRVLVLFSGPVGGTAQHIYIWGSQASYSRSSRALTSCQWEEETLA